MPSFCIAWGHAVSLHLNVFSFLQKLFPWVGLRKINVSYWGWEDNTPFTNTSLQWLPGEPNDSGFCAYLERAQVSGLRANPCNANTDGLICEKAVGEALVTMFIFPALFRLFCFFKAERVFFYPLWRSQIGSRWKNNNNKCINKQLYSIF